MKIKVEYDEVKFSFKVFFIVDSINVKMKNVFISVGSGGLSYIDFVVGREFDLVVNKEFIYNMIKNKEYKILEFKVNF